MMNTEDARKYCPVFASTHSGILIGYTQTSAASGTEVDVFLSVSMISIKKLSPYNSMYAHLYFL